MGIPYHVHFTFDLINGNLYSVIVFYFISAGDLSFGNVGQQPLLTPEDTPLQILLDSQHSNGGITPPQNVPLQNVPPQNVPPQNVPPQNVPPQNVPPQNVPPQNVPPQNVPPQNVPPQNVPPQNVPPQNVPPQNVPHQNVPPQNVPHQNVPPQNVPPQNVPEQSHLKDVSQSPDTGKTFVINQTYNYSASSISQTLNSIN